MSENSKIEWTDHTFNPWEGCQKVGPGCDHCYAETRNARFAGGVAINWGPGAPRRRTSSANWYKPLAWNKAHADFFAEHGRRQRVFCASLADVFDNAVPDTWRADLFELIDATPNLDWLLLTKRIGNVGNMLPVPFDFDKLFPNVWIGATIVNQEEADRDIPKLLQVPAAKRFLSMEPLLGPVDLARWVATANVKCKECERPFWLHEANPCEHRDGGAWTLACPNCGGCKCQPGWTPADARLICMEPPADWIERTVGRFDRVHPTISLHSGIDWVIVGGESGHGARPMHPEWVRDLRDQCAIARVPFLFKQWGEWAPGECASNTLEMRSVQTARWFGNEWAFNTIAGNSEFHRDDEPDLYRAGKKAAGRLLDGVQHDGYPS